MIFGNVANVVQAERVILIAEIELKVVVTVVVVDGHAHLKHLRLVLFQIGLHVHGIVTGHHVHSLHPFLVRFVSVQRNGRERESEGNSYRNSSRVRARGNDTKERRLNDGAKRFKTAGKS